MIYFTADLHFHHKNLVRCLSTWEDQAPCRDFSSLQEMDETIINNINSVVNEDDVLYILGDFAIAPLKNWPFYRTAIRCKTVHLILGNHDPKKELLKLDRPLFKNAEITPSKLFTSIKFVDEITVKTDTIEQRISLSHYSHRTWNRAHHGAWLLYGHSHGSLHQYAKIPFYKMFINSILKKIKLDFCQYELLDEYKYKTMDVGIDTNNFMPYSFEEIQNLFRNRRNLSVDHHTESK